MIRQVLQLNLKIILNQYRIKIKYKIFKISIYFSNPLLNPINKINL